MTCIRLVIPTEYTRSSICKSNISLLQLPDEGELHEEGNSQITEDVGSEISEEIRKQQRVTWKERSNQRKGNLLNDRQIGFQETST